MHKIGLKLWNINTDYYYENAKKLYKNKVFDYIELYIVPGHLDLIDKWKYINIPFDIHAPHFAYDVNLSKSEYVKYNYEKYLEVKSYADKLKTEVIVYHGGIGGDFKETARQIISYNDNRILIENKPLIPLKLKNIGFNDKCIGTTYEEIKYIVDNTSCGFCLDVGHAICSANSHGYEPYSYIEKLLTLKPKRIHLSDLHIDSKFDEHLHYGDGDLDFKRIFEMLPNDVSITIETIKNSKKDLYDYILDVSYIKSML